MIGLFYLGAFLLALGVLIVVHEFGHFLVARWCGVKVLRFCVGFGQPVVSRCLGRDQTEWALAAFPLGGYVKMLDEREGEVAPDEAHRAFNRQSLLKRSLIVVAGPLANLLLAVAIYFGLFVHGVEEPRPLMGSPLAQTSAAAAGFVDGELITEMNGHPILSWPQLRWELLKHIGDTEPVKFQVINAKGEITDRRLELGHVQTDDPELDPLLQLGLRSYLPPMRPIIGRVVTGSVASLAGIQEGDRVLEVDGRRVADWRDLVSLIRDHPGKEVLVLLERGGKELEVRLVPSAETERGKTVGRIGVGSVPLTSEERARLVVMVRYGVEEAFVRSLALTWETSSFSLRMMGRMVLGEVSWRNLSGPVTIADYAGQSARMGFMAYLKFLALISISLGILNLLPIPLLDGGHLLYHTAEAIKGGPLPEKVLEVGQRLGLGVLALLMLFALFNDISRLFSS